MPDVYNANTYGQVIATGITIGPNEEQTYLANADADGVDVAIILDQNVSAGNDFPVFTHPLSPAGTYYPQATCIAMATGAIMPAECAIMLHHENRPTNVFGISVQNGDAITHTMSIVLYGDGVS